MCANNPVTATQIWFHSLKYVHKYSVSQSETFLLHFCGMKQNLFGNSSFLFLGVMLLFSDPVLAADESQRVDRRWEDRDPAQGGERSESH